MASPLPRSMQQLDQACSVRWLNWVKPQGFKAMHGLASGMMIMPRSTKASRQIHEAVVTAEKASIITAIFPHQLHHSWGRMDPTSPSWSSGPTEQLLQRPETQNEAKSNASYLSLYWEALRTLTNIASSPETRNDPNNDQRETDRHEHTRGNCSKGAPKQLQFFSALWSPPADSSMHGTTA